MAILSMTEYGGLKLKDGKDHAPAPVEPYLRHQELDYTAGVATSLELLPGTRILRLQNTGICGILIALDPTATTSSPRTPADQIEYRYVEPTLGGQGLKVSVITRT